MCRQIVHADHAGVGACCLCRRWDPAPLDISWHVYMSSCVFLSEKKRERERGRETKDQQKPHVHLCCSHEGCCLSKECVWMYENCEGCSLHLCLEHLAFYVLMSLGGCLWVGITLCGPQVMVLNECPIKLRKTDELTPYLSLSSFCGHLPPPLCDLHFCWQNQSVQIMSVDLKTVHPAHDT